jgi:hypothetical protein
MSIIMASLPPPFPPCPFRIVWNVAVSAAWPTLSSRLHKADLSESFYNEAEEFMRLLSDIEIDVLNRKGERPVKPF